VRFGRAGMGLFMIRVTAMRLAVIGAVVISTASCTENAASGPSTQPSLFAPQFSGTWTGSAVLTGVTSVSDGECVQPTLQAQVGTTSGTERINLTLSQDNQNLAARLSSSTTGLACTYEGSAAQNTLALNAAACDAETLIVRCTNGSVRNLELVGSTVQGVVSGGAVNGTVANSYNVFDAVTGIGVTRVTMSYQMAASKP
jgi:hypothetical protein